MDIDHERYRITRRLGGGGTGAVYAAVDTVLGRTVALKALDASLDPEVLRREARALARLDHPHVVALHDLVERDGRAYLVMECVDGISLAERLDRDGPLELEPALQLIRQIAGAVAWAHTSGILHCDIKPANVLLSNAGVAKLADFTLVRPINPDASPSTEGGTTGFAAPEQLAGGPVDRRTDVYALGRLLDVILLPTPNPRSSRDRAVRALIARATMLDPAARYPDVSELLAALPTPRAGVTHVTSSTTAGEMTRIVPTEPGRSPIVSPRSVARRGRALGMVALPIVVAATVVAGAELVNRFSAAASPERVTVPNLTHTQRVSAEQVTSSLLLRHRETLRFSGSVPSGEVITQRPAAGTHLLKNSIVTLIISRGPRPVVIPDLSNLAQADAVARLHGIGLRVRIVTSTTVFRSSGDVLGQDPVPGVSRTPGATVTLTVSQAPCWMGIIAC